MVLTTEKNQDLRIAVTTSSGFLKDVDDKGRACFTANISLMDFKDIPNNRNLREPKKDSPCIADMRTTLQYEPQNFRRKHSGVMLFSSDIAEINGKDFELTFAGRDGIGNGGHTRLMSEMEFLAGNTFPDAYVCATIYNSSDFSDEEIREMVVANNKGAGITEDCLFDGTEQAEELVEKLPEFISSKLEIRKNKFDSVPNAKYMTMKKFSGIMEYMDFLRYACYNNDNCKHPTDSDKDSLHTTVEGKANFLRYAEEIPTMLKLWEYIDSSVASIMENEAFIKEMEEEYGVNFNAINIKRKRNTKSSLFYGFPIKYSSTGYFCKLIFAGMRSFYAIDSNGGGYCVVDDIVETYEKCKFDIWRKMFIFAQNYMTTHENNHESKRFTHGADSFSSIYDYIYKYACKYAKNV